jgi:hypothetical protein
MNPPARPLKTELNEALVGGIRQRGPEAFGWMLVALTRIAITVVVLALMLIASWAGGYEVTAWPFAGMTTVSGLLSWLLTQKRGQEEDAGADVDRGRGSSPSSGRDGER